MTRALANAMIHEEEGVFGVSFPDFPGCVTAARTIAEALQRASAIVSFHVAGMVEDGLPIPVMRSWEEIRADADWQEVLPDATLAVVAFDLPTKAVRVTISMDEHLLDAVDRAAKAAGQSRSAYLAEAVRARMLKGAA